MTGVAVSGAACVDCSLRTDGEGNPMVANQKLAAQRALQGAVLEYSALVSQTDPEAEETAGGTMSAGLTDAWVCSAADAIALTVDQAFSAARSAVMAVSDLVASQIAQSPECVKDGSGEAEWGGFTAKLAMWAGGGS